MRLNLNVKNFHDAYHYLYNALSLHFSLNAILVCFKNNGYYVKYDKISEKIYIWKKYAKFVISDIDIKAYLNNYLIYFDNRK